MADTHQTRSTWSFRALPGYGFSGKPSTTGGPRAHRAYLDRADEAPWLYEICGARRRLGCTHHATHGHASGTGLLGIHTNMPGAAVFQPTNSMRTISWCSFMRKAWPTPRRWGTAATR